MYNQEQTLIIDSLKEKNAAKSWIVIGPRGIGKVEFAQNLVKALTHDFNEFNPSVQWVSCGLTETAKREIQKAILAGEKPDEKEWTKKTEITVDDVRDGCRFLSLKSNKIKILIFNLADEMNENAQNALLKTLEEPYPNTLILLLCENVGHLMATVLSRCQKIHLAPNNQNEFEKQLLKKHPELSQMDCQEIGALSNYILGQAEEIIRLDGLMIYAQLQALLKPPQNINGAELLAFAEQVTKSKDLFNMTKRLMQFSIADLAKKYTQISMEKAHMFSELYQQIQTLFYQTNSLNLDKKQIIISMIYKISETL